MRIYFNRFVDLGQPVCRPLRALRMAGQRYVQDAAPRKHGRVDPRDGMEGWTRQEITLHQTDTGIAQEIGPQLEPRVPGAEIVDGGLEATALVLAQDVGKPGPVLDAPSVTSTMMRSTGKP
jgi:hypothetical protein